MRKNISTQGVLQGAKKKNIYYIWGAMSRVFGLVLKLSVQHVFTALGQKFVSSQTTQNEGRRRQIKMLGHPYRVRPFSSFARSTALWSQLFYFIVVSQLQFMPTAK